MDNVPPSSSRKGRKRPSTSTEAGPSSAGNSGNQQGPSSAGNGGNQPGHSAAGNSGNQPGPSSAGNSGNQPGPSSAGNSGNQASSTAPSIDQRIRQSRKRPAPSPSTSSSSSTSTASIRYNGDSTADTSENYTNVDFICPICMETMKEPTITFCGHTYCKDCILETAKTSARCPNCNSHLSLEKTCPNHVLNDILARRSRRTRAIQAEFLEGATEMTTGSATLSGQVTNLLTSDNYEHLNLNDVDRLMMVLQRRREIMASNDQEFQRKLLPQFLTQLLKIKGAHMEQLQREISLITRDISAVGDDSSSSSDLSYNNSVPFASASTSKGFAAQSSSSSVGIGFNTQPLKLDQDQQSLSDRQKRMQKHFEELTQIYFDARKAEIFDNRGYADGFVRNEQIKIENMEDELSCFGRTLSHVTQYQSLKPLVTLAYSGDDMEPNSNIVSSIEFDKDSEFFALAAVTKKIKLYEYITVLGSPKSIHCPTAELICNAKINCLSWSNYFKNNLASSHYDGCVALWDASTCTKTRNFFEHQRRVWSVDWSAGSPSLLASGSDDSKVKLWSTNSEGSVLTLDANANVCSVKFCPESEYVIAYGSADHCIYYYDFRNASEPLGVLYGHKKAVSYVKFAGKEELVSASTDNTLKLWDLKETYGCTRSFSGHINEKNFVGLATDGNFIACGSENNSLYVYYKNLPKPLFSFKFETHRTMLEEPWSDKSEEFVSAVAWKKESPVVIAANSLGAVKILEMV